MRENIFSYWAKSLSLSMVTVSRVHNFFRGLLEIPRNFVTFNAEDKLIQQKYRYKKTDMESSRSEDLPSFEIPNFRKAGKVRRQYHVILVSLS